MVSVLDKADAMLTLSSAL